MTRTPRTLLVVVLVASTSRSDAGKEKPASEPLADGKEFAKEASRIAEELVRDGAFDAMVPGYVDQSSPLQELYTTDFDGVAQLERSALQNAQTDPTVSYLTDAHGNRKHFLVDPQADPLLRNKDRIAEAAGSIGGEGNACQSLPLERQSASGGVESCEVTATRRHVRQSCSQSLELSCDYGAYYRNGCTADWITLSSTSADMTWRYEDGAWEFGVQRDNTWHATCALFRRTLSFDLQPQHISVLRLRRIEYDDWAAVRFNGEAVYFGPRDSMNTLEVDGKRVVYSRRGDRVDRAACDLKQNRSQSLDIDLLPFAREGTNTVEMDIAVGGGGEGYLEIEALTPFRETYIERCNEGFQPHGRTPTMLYCSETGTRYINGWPVHRFCWTWRRFYSYREPPVFEEDAACGHLRQRGCEQTAAECTERSDDGHCDRQVLRFRCPKDAGQADVELCPEILTCPDGDCASEYHSTHDATQDFQAAATHLSVAMEAAQHLDIDSLRTFSGESLSCHNAGLGFANCCRSGGWGVDASLTECTDQEHRLGVARAQGQAHFVGRYSSGTWGMTTRRVYCVYPSRLARIVIEQGKSQLGHGFGSARSPDCSGFSETELERLDFNAMDLSELYTAALDNAQGGDVPDPHQLAEQLREKVERLSSGQEAQGHE